MRPTGSARKRLGRETGGSFIFVTALNVRDSALFGLVLLLARCVPNLAITFVIRLSVSRFVG
jgi:hypothetical protein